MVVVDFADSECEASAKSVTVCARREDVYKRQVRYADNPEADYFLIKELKTGFSRNKARLAVKVNIAGNGKRPCSHLHSFFHRIVEQLLSIALPDVYKRQIMRCVLF